MLTSLERDRVAEQVKYGEHHLKAVRNALGFYLANYVSATHLCGSSKQNILVSFELFGEVLLWNVCET